MDATVRDVATDIRTANCALEGQIEKWTENHPQASQTLAEICAGEGVNLRLTGEQHTKAFALFGVCVYEVCDRCGKFLAEVRWTRKDRPETYCSRLCRDGVDRMKGRCEGCGVDLAGRRRGARWCSDTCRIRHRVKDATNNPKKAIQNNGLAAA